MKCKFEGCDNEAVHSTLSVCRTCYNGLRYWRDKTLAHKRTRLQQIVRLNSRMEYLITGSPVPKRKRRANNIIMLNTIRKQKQ